MLSLGLIVDIQQFNAYNIGLSFALEEYLDPFSCTDEQHKFENFADNLGEVTLSKFCSTLKSSSYRDANVRQWTCNYWLLYFWWSVNLNKNYEFLSMCLHAMEPPSTESDMDSFGKKFSINYSRDIYLVEEMFVQATPNRIILGYWNMRFTRQILAVIKMQ